ncbi:MAG: tRNA lysidine(34) synthetase TilS [Devosiaceae bacterium]|nr:tRNA lysidine(34) synthetase TilS [Devosiaceae bacterium]
MLNFDDLLSPIKAYKKIALGVSGGADSLALMLIVAKWVSKIDETPQVFVYSVDHKLRPNSDKEVAYVIKQAKKLGLKAKALSWQGKKPTTGIQEKARIARYQLIKQAMKQDKVEILLTGHHAYDQAETILMRMAHSSGIKGLGGMNKFSKVEEVKIFRPLLEISPTLLHEIVANSDLRAINDPSNENKDFERIRWRKILPSLFELGLNERQFSIFSKRIKRANEALEENCLISFEKIITIDILGILHIDKQGFNNLSQEIKIRTLQKAIRYIGNDAKPFALAKIEQLSTKMQDAENFKKLTLHKCNIAIKDNYFEISKELSYLPKKDIILNAGEQVFWDNRFIIENTSPKKKINISSSININRADLKDMPSFITSSPMSNIRSAPLIRDNEKNIIALGTHVIDKDKTIDCVIFLHKMS